MSDHEQVENQRTSSSGEASHEAGGGTVSGVGLGTDLGTGNRGIGGGSEYGSDLGGVQDTASGSAVTGGNESSRAPSTESNWSRAPELAAGAHPTGTAGGGSAGPDDAPGTAGGGGTYFGPGTTGFGANNATSGTSTSTVGVGSQSDVGGGTTGPGGGGTAT